MQPVDKHYKSVQELVLFELRRQIYSGNLKAGQRLIVRELAEMLQVSATPIRLALTQLASEGFVRIVGPRRGVEVCRITADEVEELYLMRIALEKLAVHLGAKFKTPEPELWRLPVDTLPTQITGLETLARLWQRETELLLPVALYLDAHEVDPTPAEAAGGHALALTHLLDRVRGVVFLGTREAWPALETAATFEVGYTTPAEQQAA